MDEPWKSLALLFGSGFIAWLTSKLTMRANIHTEWFKGTVREAIEPRLIDLKAKWDRDLEKRRQGWQREALIHEVKFRKLYDRVSVTVARSFRLVTEAYDSGSKLISVVDNDGISKDVKAQQFVKDFNDVQKFILRNRIFLPRQLHLALEKLLNPLRDVAMEFQVMMSERNGADRAKRWMESDQKFRATVMHRYEELCSDVQLFLGLEPPGQGKP